MREKEREKEAMYLLSCRCGSTIRSKLSAAAANASGGVLRENTGPGIVLRADDVGDTVSGVSAKFSNS